MIEIVFTIAIKATGLQARNLIELHHLSNEGLNKVDLIFLLLTANASDEASKLL
ncbi:MAG: hypothetical protein OXU36_12990 [Candidatus Poribacteria bacterium]|nr:hypothetical protein [Candidatus Poribacteria bacterium]